MSSNINIGWSFDNSYTSLPPHFYEKVNPRKVKNPSIVLLNNDLAKELGLNFEECPKDQLAQVFSGNILLKNAEPIAQAYAGHQFGHFTMLGDGRAHLLGEHITKENKRFDVQLKGSGPTKYSRNGDGRAALGPMLREYIISEAMNHLGVPTTRSLAVIKTGEKVRREKILPGAILTRVASSHIRFGSFQYLASKGNKNDLKALADYSIKRHYPELKASSSPYVDFFNAVMRRQIFVVTEWMRVGFIHGVMNTDNMTISGETIDYGPCAFMDVYNPETVFSSIDRNKRYAFANQPDILQWNLARFAEALLPLFNDDIKKSVSIAENAINSFSELFETSWLKMMRKKLGFFGEDKDDKKIINDLLQWMKRNEVDYTNFFSELSSKEKLEEKKCQNKDFIDWHKRWESRLKRNSENIEENYSLIKKSNPVFIPRNHKVEEALLSAEKDYDYAQVNELNSVMSKPYIDNLDYSEFQNPPKKSERIFQTFCGT